MTSRNPPDVWLGVSQGDRESWGPSVWPKQIYHASILVDEEALGCLLFGFARRGKAPYSLTAKGSIDDQLASFGGDVGDEGGRRHLPQE